MGYEEGADEMYVIIVGEYSDWDIVGATEDKELAVSIAKVHDGYVMPVDIITDKTYIDRAARMIHETEVYLKEVKNRYTGKFEYYVSSVYNHEVEQEKEDKFKKFLGYALIYIYNGRELSKEEASKIAYDRIAKYKAEKEGI